MAFGPAKAANAGGVAVSGLEMAQNRYAGSKHKDTGKGTGKGTGKDTGKDTGESTRGIVLPWFARHTHVADWPLLHVVLSLCVRYYSACACNGPGMRWTRSCATS